MQTFHAQGVTGIHGDQLCPQHRINVSLRSSRWTCPVTRFSLLLAFIGLIIFPCLAMSGKQTNDILDCSDNILGETAACHDAIVMMRVRQLDFTYRQLTASKDRDLAFLASQAKLLLYRSLNYCRNEYGGKPPVAQVDTCINRQLDEQQLSTHEPVTKTSLLAILRKGQLLTLDLLSRYPDQFVDLHASWFAGMHLRPGNDGSLVGIISDYKTKLRYPATIPVPDQNTRVFFTEGGCRNGCDSWWSGRFERRGPRIVFIADNN